MLSAGIYFVNLLYLVGKYLLDKFRPSPTPISSAYPNIFHGIEHNALDEDVDQVFEQVDEDVFQSSQSQWISEGHWSDSEDFKFPSTSGTYQAYELSPGISGKLDQSENDDDDNENEVVQGEMLDNRKKMNYITVPVENGAYSEAKNLPTNSTKKDRKNRGNKNKTFGNDSASLSLRFRVYCEKMTSVSYPTGRFMVIFSRILKCLLNI